MRGNPGHNVGSLPICISSVCQYVCYALINWITWCRDQDIPVILFRYEKMEDKVFSYGALKVENNSLKLLVENLKEKLHNLAKESEKLQKKCFLFEKGN